MPQHRINWPEPMDAEERKAYLDPTNPTSPYFGFIGNRNAVDKLIRIDFQALGREDHECSDLPIAVLGQAGCGKSNLVARHCKANDLPTAKIFPRAIKTLHDISEVIATACKDEDVELIPNGKARNYLVPPMNIFIDEVHALSPNIVQGLLNATEHDDGILVTEKGFTLDCSHAHWIIATTDRGKLFDAFDTRFSKVNLNLYTKDEVAQIVQFVNPDLDWHVCKLVAHYCGKIPREALAFARELKMEQEMNTERPWTTIATKVAADNEIDDFGMTYKRVAILTALGQGPISEKRLPVIAGCKIEELEKFILPWMMATTPDQAALVGVGHNGYVITEAGLIELDIRKIHHKEAA